MVSLFDKTNKMKNTCNKVSFHLLVTRLFCYSSTFYNFFLVSVNKSSGILEAD